jgi:fibronectin-binding autotransporter adhesin
MRRVSNRVDRVGGRLSVRLLRTASLAALATVALGAPSQAADLNWDGNSTTVGAGGSGTWNTTALNWSDSTNGVAGPYHLWNNSGLDNAIFGGTAGTVIVTGGVTVNGVMTFNTTGYTLTGGPLTLGGATPTINGSGAATITSVLAGTSGLTLAGTGALTLGGANTFTGAVNVNTGRLIVSSNANLGASTNVVNLANGTRLDSSGSLSGRTINLTGLSTIAGGGAGAAHFTGTGGLQAIDSVTLSDNTNDFTGQATFLVDGTASFTSVRNAGQASSLGAGTGANATIRATAQNSFADTFAYTGTGDTSDRPWEFDVSGASSFTSFANLGSGKLTLTGNLTSITTSTSILGFNAQNADLDLLGVISSISDRTIAFRGGVGNRIITLGGANTYGGSTLIGNGAAVTVRAPVLADTGASSSFGTGTAGGINITNGSVLSYTGAGSSSNRPWTIGAAGAPRATISNDGTGALMLSGAVTFDPVANNGLTLAGGFAGVNTLSGVMSGSGALTVNGAGTWALSGANTQTGTLTVLGGTLRADSASAFGAVTGTTVNAGSLDLNGFDMTTPTLTGTGGGIALGSGTLTVDQATTTGYAGVISGSGDLVKQGVGSLTLTGANTYTGATNLQAGTLKLDFSAAGAPASNIIAASSVLNLSGGSTLNVVGGGAASTQTFAGTNITSGSNTIRATSGAGGLTLDLGAINRTGGLVNFVLPTTGAIKTSSTTLGGWAMINSTDYAKVVGGSIVAFDNTDYTANDNAATWGAGQVITETTGGNGFTGTVGGTVQLGGLRYTEPKNTTVTIAGGATLGVDGAILVAPTVNSAAQVITGGSITGASGGGALGIQQNSTGPFTIASTIVDNGGATGFTKGGTGSVTLSGANTYTGATTISQGTLQVATLANGGQASGIGASTADPSNLIIDSSTFSYTGGTVATDRGFTVAATAGVDPTVNVSTAGANLTFSGQVVGTGDGAGLTKAGDGTLTLTNTTSNYTGPTTISDGVLSVATLGNGGLPGSTLGSSSSASANLVIQTGGALQYTGGTTSSNRGFTLNGIAGGVIDVTQAATTLTISGTAVGLGSAPLTKDGAGTLVLSGTNTYTGQTFVNGGVLRAGSTQAFGGPNLMTLADTAGVALDLAGNDTRLLGLVGGGANGGNVLLGGATLTIGGTPSSFGGLISGAGGLTKDNTNLQVLSNCGSTYTGVTTLLAGTLSVSCLANGGQASAIGSSSAASTNLVFRGGNLEYTGGTVSTDRGFQLLGTGNITVDDPTAQLAFSGAVTGSGQWSKFGPGTLILSGANTYTGTANVRGGTLQAGSSSAFGTGPVSFDDVAGAVLDLGGFDVTVRALTGGGTMGGDVHLGGNTLTLSAPSGVVAYAGAISGTGGLVKVGGFTQQLTGCASSYTGATTITGGTLEVSCLGDGGANSSIGASAGTAGNLVLNGGTLSYVGTGDSTDRLLTLGASATSALDASGTGAVVFTNTGAVAFSSPNTTQTVTLTGTSGLNNSLGLQITDNGSGKTGLSKTGLGTWILTNPGSTYTGVTTITGGVLGVDKLANGGVASSIGQSSAIAANLVIGAGGTLRYTGAGDTTNRLFTLASGVTDIDASGTGAIVFTDTGLVTLQTTNATHIVALGGTNTGDNTLAGSLRDAGTGATTLAKNDAGKWVLTGNSTYTGLTNINAGTLVVGGGGTTGSITSATINNAGVLGFNRSDSLTYAGVVQGVGALQQDGAGTTILTGANIYTGGTTISAGTLQLGGGGATGSIVGDVANDGVLAFNRNNQYAFSGLISGSGGVQQTGPGATVLSANNSYTGATDIKAGTLRINGDQSAATGLTTVFDGATLGGSGTIGGSVVVQNGGAIAPGNSPGTLTIHGALTLNPTSILNMEFGQANVAGGSLNDLISVNGNLTLDGTINVTVPTGGVFSAGVYRIATYNGSLTDNGLDVGALPNGTAANVQTSVLGQVNLVNTAGQTLFFWDGQTGVLNDGVITGGIGTWRLGGGANLWTGSDGTANGDFMQNAFAVFQGTPGQVTVDSTGGAVGVSGVQFAVDGYSVVGASLTLAAAQTAINVGDGTPASTAMTATIDSILSGAGQLVKVGDGTLVLRGANTYTGGTLIQSGVLSIANDGSLGGAGAVTLDGGTLENTGIIATTRAVVLNAGGGTFLTDQDLKLTGVTGTGGLTTTGLASLTLLGANTYTGGTTVGNARLQLGDGSTAGSITGDVLVNSGQLVFDNPGTTTFDEIVSGAGGLGTAGNGTVVLTGTNTYSGNTDVASGTLLVDGDMSGATGLVSASGTGTVGGTGVIGGAVTTSGTGTLAPGDATVAPGTLTINGDLTLVGGSKLNYDFGQAGVPGGPLNDLLKVGGNVSLGGATINVAQSSGGSLDPGLYRVIGYAGTSSGTLAIGSMPGGTNFVVQTSVDKQVNLVNTAGLTVNMWDGAAGGRNDHLVSGGDGVWQGTSGNDNWTPEDGSVNAAYSDSAFAIFAKAPGAVIVDAVSNGPVNASGMQFAVDGYNVSGDGITLTGAQAFIRVGDGTADGAAMTATIDSALSGSSQLIKSDLGTLVLTGANSYAGGTQVNGGVLRVDGDQSAATGLATVNAGGTLSGSGILGGGVTVASGGALAPGGANPGMLTINGDLTLAAGSTLNMRLGQAGTDGGALNDLVVVNGNVSLGGTLNVSTSAGGVFGPGIYRVIDYTGALTDNGLAIGALPSDSGVIQTSIANQVNLLVDVSDGGTPGGGGGGGPGGTGPGGNPGGGNPGGGASTYTFWDGGGVAADGKIAGGDGAWQAAGDQAWASADGTKNGAYANGGFAIFAGQGGTVTVDGGQGAVTASGMQFAADGYHLTGDAITLTGAAATVRVGDGTTAGAAFKAVIDAPLTGAAQLVKTDGGTLVLAGANTYTGGTTISGGALQLGEGGTSGSILGDVVNNGVLAFDRSDATTFSGAISGTGGVQQIGGGATTLTAANTYAGGTRIDAGTLTGSATSFGSGAILDNATLVVDQAADAGFANAIDGTGAFVKTGAGALTYAGTATLSGPTTVSAGALIVRGSLASSPVTVQSGATLGGAGSVGAVTLQTGSAVSPGEGIGTLTVNGAYAQAAGATYQLEIDPRAGVADKIVVSGAASLSAGAALNVNRTGAGAFTPGAVYTVLTAAGGVSGAFDLKGDTVDVSAFLALKANYDPNDVWLTVVQNRPLSTSASTPNQAVAAGAADQLPTNSDVRTALLNLPTDAAAQAAFDRLSGEVHASAQGVLVAQNGAVRDAVLARLSDAACGVHDNTHENAACPDDRAAGWAQVLGGWGRVGSDGNATGLGQSSTGFLIGFDAPVGAWRAGVFAGYTRSDWDLNDERGSGDSDDYHLGAYGGRRWDALKLSLGADYTRHQIETGRSAAFPGFAQNLNAKYGADGGDAFADLAYKVERGGIDLEPFADVAHVVLSTDSFTEKGGSAALSGASETMQTTVTTLGVRPSTAVTLGSVKATVRGMIGWRHGFGDVDPNSHLAFASGGDSFDVHGAPIARNTAALEAGIDAPFADNGVVSLSYGGQFGGGTTDQRVRVDLHLRF